MVPLPETEQCCLHAWGTEGSLGPDHQLSYGDETMSEVAQEGTERNRRNMGPCRTLGGWRGGRRGRG